MGRGEIPSPLLQNATKRKCQTKPACRRHSFGNRTNAMRNFLDMAGGRQHQRHRFNQHANISLTALAGFEVGWMPVIFLKSPITKHDHILGYAIDRCLKVRALIDTGHVHTPTNIQTKMIQQQTQLVANNPASLRFSLACNLTLTASFTMGMNLLNPKCINQPNQR